MWEVSGLSVTVIVLIISEFLFSQVANVRHSQLLESHFKGIILAKIITNEGRTIKYESSNHRILILV